MPKNIPKPSILDECEYLGFINGERRWRYGTGRRLYTWDPLHGEIEVFNQRGKHLGALDPITGQLIKQAVKGEPSMSSTQNRHNFIDLYVQGRALAEDIDDYIDLWHASAGNQPLYEFLGMAKEEYSLWCQDPDVLPYIALARKKNIPLQEVLSRTVTEWKIAMSSSDVAKVKRLKQWLEAQGLTIS